MSQILGYTGPVSAEQLPGPQGQGYLPDDLIGKAGVEATYETELRGTYGSESVERDAPGREIQVLQTVADAVAGDSLELTIDTEMQKDAQKALKWAMKTAGLKRGVVIVMNPQTGEVLAMVSLPTYDNNLFASGISNSRLQQARSRTRTSRCSTTPSSDQYPPGLDLQARRPAPAALADGKITPPTGSRRGLS